MSVGLPPAGSVLKPLVKYLQQARIVEKVDPLISYYCRLYALQLGMKIANKSKDDLRLIGEQMGWLESHQSLAAGLSKEEGRARCEAFALQVFEHGDTEDRAGLASKKTALNFHAAFVLLDMCRQFGPLASDVEEKLRYAVVKAADINKAIKEGRKPKAGPLVDNSPVEEESMGGVAGGSGDGAVTGLPHFGTAASPFVGGAGVSWQSPAASSSSSSVSASAPAPFGADSAGFSSFNDASAPPPSAPFNPHAFPSTSMQPPPAQPTQPAQPASSPAQPSLFGRPSGAASSSTPSPPAGSARSATGPSPFSAEASAARAAAAAAAGHGGGAFTRKDTRKLDAVRDGERLIKHALSAVVFSDVDTTVAKLREALHILQPFTTTSPQ